MIALYTLLAKQLFTPDVYDLHLNGVRLPDTWHTSQTSESVPYIAHILSGSNIRMSYNFIACTWRLPTSLFLSSPSSALLTAWSLLVDCLGSLLAWGHLSAYTRFQAPDRLDLSGDPPYCFLYLLYLPSTTTQTSALVHTLQALLYTLLPSSACYRHHYVDSSCSPHATSTTTWTPPLICILVALLCRLLPPSASTLAVSIATIFYIFR